MLFPVTICLLLCQAFSSEIQSDYQSGNPHQLRSASQEISPVLNEIAPDDGLLEDVSYKPVTLETLYSITKKQQHCLKIGDRVKSISRASLRAPLSNSNYHDTLKVVCSSQQEPKIWFGQSKYQEFDHNEKVQSLSYEDLDTAIVGLSTLKGTLSFELPGCNVCVKNNETDPNYVNVFVAPNNAGQRSSDGSQVDFSFQGSPNGERKPRVKRATNSIKISASSAKKNVGETFTVSCSAKTNNITWKDPKGKEVKSSVNSDPRVKESFTKSQNYSELIFRSISAAADGRYTCTVNEAGKIDTEVFTLTAVSPVVKPKAKLTPSSNKVNLEEGSDYTVECSGNSNNITWKHGLNYFIPTYPGGSNYFFMIPPTTANKTTLFFKNATSNFAGEYICSVNSSGLQDTEKLVISITKPRLTFSPDDKNDISVKENKEYDITCSGPLKSVSWWFNAVEVSTNKKNDVFQKDVETKDGLLTRKLKFDDVQRDNNGKYTCSGFLSFNGSRIERSFTLTAQEDNNLSVPKITIGDDKIGSTNIYYKVNESLEVVCKGDTENIEWKGPPYNWKIPETNSTTDRIAADRIKKKKVALKFKSIAITDEGTYTCEVSKRSVTKTKNFKLYVIDPVRIIGFPQSPTTREGGYVTLGCLTSGHPKAMVNWYYNDVRPDGTSSRKLIDGQTNQRFKFDGDNLLINNITYREAGRYMCEAKQDIERGTTDMRTIDVTVQHKPYPTRNRTIFEKKLNTIIQIPCKMISNPPPYYTWSQKVDGNFRILASPSPDPILTMNFVNESQFGEYKCAANNDIGANEQHILLIPMEFPRAPKVELDKVSKTFAYFKAAAERNSSFTYYNIEYKEKDTRDWTDVNITLGETWDTKYELPNLFEKTTYLMRVRSINELGISPPSNEVEFTTAMATRLTVPFTVLFAILLKWFL